MPANIIKAYAKKLKRSESDLEKVWDEAKAISTKNGFKEGTEKFYKYTTTVFQRLLGMEDEDTVPMNLHKIKPSKIVNEDGTLKSFSDFMNINESITKTQKELLKTNILKAIDKISEDLSIKDYATVVAEILSEQYGNHLIQAFYNQVKITLNELEGK